MRNNFSLENERLKSEITFLRIKNAKLEHFISKLSDKVEFYSNLSADTEYNKGFASAFEIMKNLLKGGM